MDIFLQKLLLKFAHKLQILENISESTSLNAALTRTVIRKTIINTVIDVGASNGCWSKCLRRYYPKAFYLLIEANPYHRESLKRFKAQNQNLEYVISAAGNYEGDIYFDGTDPFGGLASHKPSEQTNLKVPVSTIDHLCQTYQVHPPYLIKLDTHGFEIPIFQGAENVLQQTNLIVVETYNFDIASESLRFPQICQYLENKGFRCVDMCNPLFRPKDNAFWQMDLFFIPASNSIFKDNKYQ